MQAHARPGTGARGVIALAEQAADEWFRRRPDCAPRQETMSRESKKKSLSYRVTTPEERIRREVEIEQRSARILALKAQGLNYATIAIRLGLSASTVSRLAREYVQSARN